MHTQCYYRTQYDTRVNVNGFFCQNSIVSITVISDIQLTILFYQHLCIYIFECVSVYMYMPVHMLIIM